MKSSQESKKRSKGAAESDEFLRSLWRMEVGRLDPGRLVFVDELGTHTSLAPLYAYAPIGEPSLRSRETVARTPCCLRASIEEGWDLLWPWKELPPPECSRLT
jgi:hypothetical protein